MVKKKQTSVQGNLFLLDDEQQSFTASQIDLLMAIGECGSITKAAKKTGISYKTAWDRIDNMNNMSDQPLVIRSTGGVHGGGTILTDTGQKVIKGFLSLQQEHQSFLNRLSDRVKSLGDVAKFMRSNVVRTSARNQYRGLVIKITRGAINTEVAVRISESATLTALITNDSCRKMHLKNGRAVIALVKSSWVLLSKDTALKTSARNNLIGKIIKIIPGQVNSEIIIDLGEEKSICAIITNTSVSELDLNPGDQACAFFKASSVILMAD